MKYSILALCLPFIAASCSLGNMGDTTPSNELPGTYSTILTAAYQEELLANTLYKEMLAKYPAEKEIANIIESEQNHMKSVGRLLEKYNLPIPTDFGTYSGAYTSLKNMIERSITGAIEAGIIIETGDINHLVDEYKKIELTDVRLVFENIGGGSFNHLRAFIRMAEAYNYTPSLDTKTFLTKEEMQSVGPLNQKMTELLLKNNLPVSGTQAGS